MKIKLSILIVLFCAGLSFGQPGTAKIYGDARDKPPTYPRTQSDAKAEAKEMKRLAKEKAKRPPQIEINAPKDKVIPLLVQGLIHFNFTIDRDSSYSITASRPLEGFKESLIGAMAVGTKYGSSPRMYMTATINEVSGVTTVILTTSLSAENVFGKSNNASLDKNKKIRQGNEDFLVSLKNEAESQK
jgi:hypothetical protein